MNLTTISDIELLALFTDQRALYASSKQNLELINEEISRRVEEHKSVKTEPVKQDNP